MFFRRLILIGVGILLAFVALGAQSLRLMAVEGDEFLEAAESRLITRQWRDTTRGEIRDRKGRVLAVDRPSWDLLVDYRVITGEADYDRAATRARREHAGDWIEASPHTRRQWIASELEQCSRETAAFWQQITDAADLDPQALADRRASIIALVQRRAGTIWDRRYEKRREEMNAERRTRVEVDFADVAKPIEEMRQLHPVATGFDQNARLRLSTIVERYVRVLEADGIARGDGVELSPSHQREYPYETVDLTIDPEYLALPIREAQEGLISMRVEGVATHVLGWMRAYTKEDVDQWREEGAAAARSFRFGDQVGAAGLEEAYESHLRGTRGLITRRRDTGEQTYEPAVPGEDLTITLDIMLQARVQAILSPELGLGRQRWWHTGERTEDEPLEGAAVVLDVETGEVLAMVTTPTFTREQKDTEPDSIFRNPRRNAFVNRAIETPYPPGSVIKPVVLASAYTQGALAPGERIRDDGHLLPERPDIFRDWFYRMTDGGMTHSALLGGPLSGAEAIARSSNVFFYTLGQRLGVEGIVRAFGRFGIGGPTDTLEGFALGGYHARAADKRDGTLAGLGDAILMGIGQGPIEWTPMHAADAYATLARGGVRLWPRLVADQPVRGEDLELDPRGVDQALRGLRMVVEWTHGTARSVQYQEDQREPIFLVPGVTVWGKSGTAQAAPFVWDRDLYERTSNSPDEPVRGITRGTHGWFCSLVGPEGGGPRYAIAVIMERAGSGSRVGGPITNAIISALREEGYL